MSSPRGANARAAAGALVIIPVASLEQHGPHLGPASISSAPTALPTAPAGSPRWVSPWWYPLRLVRPRRAPCPLRRHRHARFRGLLRMLNGVVECDVRGGFKRVMLLNGHGGNAEAVAVAGAEFSVDFGIAWPPDLLAPGTGGAFARYLNASRGDACLRGRDLHGHASAPGRCAATGWPRRMARVRRGSRGSIRPRAAALVPPGDAVRRRRRCARRHAREGREAAGGDLHADGRGAGQPGAVGVADVLRAASRRPGGRRLHQGFIQVASRRRGRRYPAVTSPTPAGPDDGRDGRTGTLLPALDDDLVHDAGRFRLDGVNLACEDFLDLVVRAVPDLSTEIAAGPMMRPHGSRRSSLNLAAAAALAPFRT